MAKVQEDPKARIKLFNRIGNAHLGRPFGFMHEWFHPTPIEMVGRDDVKRWLSWAFFDSTLEEILQSESAIQLEEMTGRLEGGMGVNFHPGSTGAPLILLNLDPVVAMHRPFIHYAAMTCIQFASRISLKCMRFHRFRHNSGSYSASYWIRKGQDDQLDPLIFIHGVGLGLAVYQPFRK
jgi:hypothetical protein